MCGILVYVKNNLIKYVKQVETNCKFAIFLKLDKLLCNSFKDILFSFTYIPPYYSNAYKNENVKGIGMIENYLLNTEIDLSEVILSIVGDLNCRTADKLDFIPDDHVPPELEEFNEVLCSSVEKRSSCDKISNKAGDELLSFSISYSLLIMNGRFGSDKDIGNFTFLGHNGNSLIDYFICNEELCSMISDFRVAELSESSHFPLEIYFKSMSDRKNTDEFVIGTVKKTCYKFNNASIEYFKQNVDNNLMSTEVYDELVDEIDDQGNEINDVIEKIKDKLQECAKCCTKTVMCRKTSQPDWFDNVCRQYKKDKYRLLRRYRNNRTDYNLTAFKNAKATFKVTCDVKKTLYNERQLNELVSNANNPKSFWKKLKFLTAKKGFENDLNIEDMKKHFENCLRLNMKTTMVRILM